MKITQVIIAVALLVICHDSDARVRSLSLDMVPSEFHAHQSLQFDKHAFNKKWLLKEIACHFNEGRKDCRNLAALLRMFVEVEPNQKRRKGFAYKTKEQLLHDEDKVSEIALFLYLYCGDDSLIYLLDSYQLEYINENQKADKVLDAATIIERLNSNHEYLIEQTLTRLLKHPKNVGLSTAVFDHVVNVTQHPLLSRQTKSAAYEYLSDMGYFVSYGHDEQGKFELGKITIHSGPACLTEYLGANPVSKVWQHYAKQLSADGVGEHRDNDIEMIHYFQKFNSFISPEDIKKIAFIKKANAYKNAKPSMKFLVGDQFMSGSNKKQAMPILKEAYKQGNNAMKSAIVAKFSEHFPVKQRFWDDLMEKSTSAEKVMIEINKKQWDINMASNHH